MLVRDAGTRVEGWRGFAQQERRKMHVASGRVGDEGSHGNRLLASASRWYERLYWRGRSLISRYADVQSEWSVGGGRGGI